MGFGYGMVKNALWQERIQEQGYSINEDMSRGTDKEARREHEYETDEEEGIEET